MKPEQLFPTVMIVLDVLASAVYWSQGNTRMCVYWIAAAVLTASVTY